MTDNKMDVIDVPGDIARQIMCKKHEWIADGKDYSMIEQKHVYSGRCKLCGKRVSNTKPHYEFDFKL
jgi:hypothetical protein